MRECFYFRGGTREEEGRVRKPSRVKTFVKTLETGLWTKAHLLQTCLHLLQVILSYLLMLIFMTYNSWLCAATVIGLALGYFLFGWRRTVVLQQSENCCH